MGLFFHKEKWLGGYGSHARRLLRLGHISFFGLGAMNLFFYFTAHAIAMNGAAIQIASVLFVTGGVAMPVCCAAAAFTKRAQPFFAIPVLSLIAAGGITLWEIVI